MKNTLTVMLVILLGSNLFSQKATTQCSCCTSEYRQFSFWLGDWEVFNNKGEKIGENKVVSMQDSCVMQENFKSEGQTGTSYTYYNKTDKLWYQVWIDNFGSIIELRGRLEGDKIILRGKKQKSTKADFYYSNRITWTKDNSGNVLQKWDIIDDKEKIIEVAFDGIYKPKITAPKDSIKKVTGIGGVFFKCKDPAKLRDWYKTHLGLNTDQNGTCFVWWQGADSTKKGYTQWSPFEAATKYFEPSHKDYMINYRVENLETLVAQLTKEGVKVVDKIEVYNYGKFVHIMDIEGNKIELWEPVDSEYGKIDGGRTK